MRIRSSHVVVLVVTALTGFILLVVMRSPDFAPISENSVMPLTTLPSVDEDPLNVAFIEFETDEFYAGEVPNDNYLFTKLHFKNRGKALLRISDIKTSCACTVGSISEERATVAPGEESYIDVRVDPFRIPGFHSEKVLTIYSNDPLRPMAKVKVSADVDPEYEVIPDEIDFGVLSKGDTPTASIVLRQLIDETFSLISVMESPLKDSELKTSGITCVSTRRPETQWLDSQKPEYDISITLARDISPGPFSRYFHVTTDVKRSVARNIRFKVKGEIEAPYTLSRPYPKGVLIKRTPGSDAQKPVRTTISADHPINLDQVLADNKSVVVKKGLDADGKSAWIDVSLAPGTPAGNVESWVRFNVISNGESYADRFPVRILDPGLAGKKEDSHDH
jgi:hypothetical protein